MDIFKESLKRAPATDSFKGDSILENYGSSINFDYNNPYTMGQGINVSGNSHMYGTETTKYNRDRVGLPLRE